MLPTILVIDDDPAQLSVITLTLSSVKYRTLSATSGAEGLHLFQAHQPDLIVLDVSMPNMDGWEVCARIRETSTVPIIFLSGRHTTDDKVTGLNIGGDDYLIKPFKPTDLHARIDAVLRRTYGAHQPLSNLLHIGPDILIHIARREVFVRGQNLPLQPVTFALLLLLAKHPDKTVAVDRIAATLNLNQARAAERVKWHIWKLRQAIELDPKHPDIIITDAGYGYRLQRG